MALVLIIITMHFRTLNRWNQLYWNRWNLNCLTYWFDLNHFALRLWNRRYGCIYCILSNAIAIWYNKLLFHGRWTKDKSRPYKIDREIHNVADVRHSELDKCSECCYYTNYIEWYSFCEVRKSFLSFSTQAKPGLCQWHHFFKHIQLYT